MKLLVTGGGSGGHIYPALAIIDVFKQKENNLDLLYIGTHDRMEKDIVPAENINYIPIEIYGFSKTKILRDIKNIFLIQNAYKKCLRIMDEFKPDVVIGVGGFVTYPVLKAAFKKGIPVFMHEQNSIPGKANLALEKYTTSIGVSFESSIKHFKKCKDVFVSGNPVGERALALKPMSKGKLGLSPSKKLVLIVSGSQGSTSVNAKMKEYLKSISDRNYEVVYITGSKHYDNFIEGETFSKNVKVLPYLDNLSSLFPNVDLIITRAGASTISELIATKLPSILIPSPYVANNHQYYNATDMVEAGCADILEEKDLTVKALNTKIDNILNNDKNYEKMTTSLAKLRQLNSSEVIYNKIKDMIK